jgi:hypothetical protein
VRNCLHPGRTEGNSSMNEQAEGFVHRTKGDLTIESICCRCYLTVSSAKSKHELLQDEPKHQCSGSVGVRRISPDQSKGV